MCKQVGCKKRPIYNVEGETKAIYCSAHKKDGMVDVVNKSCCEVGCKNKNISFLFSVLIPLIKDNNAHKTNSKCN